MLFNVSQLLREHVGASRTYVLDPEPPVHHGTVEMIRTPDSVLVRFKGDVVLEDVCSRCLAPFGYRENIAFEEVFAQQVDPATGIHLPDPEDADAFRIGFDHSIDISEAVRQYSEVAAAMQPLCRPDCPGICSVCGQDLSIGVCSCDRTPTDPRWAGLRALKLSNG